MKAMNEDLSHVIVSLNNIKKSFNDIVAVNNVSVQIREGEFFSLLGPSGCGKTTLLRIIAGFESPETGDILINDKLVIQYHQISDQQIWYFRTMLFFLI